MITPAGRAQLVADEGTRRHVYDDATGLPIGPGSILKGNPTIGVGRNLGPSGPGIAADEAAVLFDNDLDQIAASLDARLPEWRGWPGVAQDVAIMVSFNCGVDGFLTFRRMIGAIQEGDLDAAAKELLDSEAAKELPARYSRMAAALATGSWT